MDNSNTNSLKPAQKSKAKIIAKTSLVSVLVGTAVYFLINHIAYDADAAPFFAIFSSMACFLGSLFFILPKITTGKYLKKHVPHKTEFPSYCGCSPSSSGYASNPLNPASPLYINKH